MTRIVASALLFLFAFATTMVVAKADEIVLVSTHSRNHVGAGSGPGGLLQDVPHAAQALVVDRITLGGRQVAFRARNGQFVRAGIGRQTYLGAVSPHIRGWETFEVVPVSASKFAIKSMQNGRYVSLGRHGRLAATADAIGSRETFSSRPAPVEAAAERQRIWLPLPARADGPVLAGRWSIHRVRTFEGRLAPIPAALRGEDFVRIRDNGSLAATAGCNDISARVRHEGGLVQIGEVMTTKRLCFDDRGAYELLLLAAFDHSRNVDDMGDQLRFFDRDGDPVLVLRRN